MSRRTYGKKKQDKVKNVVPQGAPEPLRVSLLDTLRDNLEQAKRNIYLLRIIYLGEHSFPPEGQERVSDVFRDVVDNINKMQSDEPLTGIFLYYKKFFVHMMEGSEESIMKHFYLLGDHEAYQSFTNMKLAIVINHINQRFIKDWIEVPGKPQTLLEKLDPNCDVEQSSRYIFTFVQKMYQLCNEIREIKLQYEKTAEVQSSETKKPEELPPISFDSSVYEKLLKTFYPEINVLQFMVQSRFVRNLEDYINLYRYVPSTELYQEKVWPVPTTMVPYKVFIKSTDPCVDLPTHKVEKIEEIVIADDDIL